MSSWDLANRGGKLGLVWINRKKISQIINDNYLPFFLLIILWHDSWNKCLPNDAQAQSEQRQESVDLQQNNQSFRHTVPANKTKNFYTNQQQKEELPIRAFQLSSTNSSYDRLKFATKKMDL